jgi:hypothetical protein
MNIQSARPVQDVTNSGWSLVPASPANVYAKLNDIAPDDDLSYVSSSNNPQGDSFEVKLAGLAVPVAGQDGQLTVRLRSTSGNSIPVSLILLQGSGVLVHQSVSPNTTYSNVVINVPAAVLASITDFTDLRLRVVAGALTVTCCPSNPVPAVLFATFSGGTGGCSCLNGQTLELTYNTTTHTWMSPVEHLGNCSPPNSTNQLALACGGALGWGLGISSSNGGCNASGALQVFVTCSPFSVGFAVSMTGCCVGTVNCVVTV